MMQFRPVELKREGEKLLRLYLTLEGDTIARVRITGDFFVYPEEAIETIEASLEGMKREEEELIRRIETLIRSRGIQLVGISAETIAIAVVMAGGG
ncbi:MAG: biotin--protein ligase [Spirochaetes bacterium]|nr:biotin--protein ligase [Spirochaetota bacterium]